MYFLQMQVTKDYVSIPPGNHSEVPVGSNYNFIRTYRQRGENPCNFKGPDAFYVKLISSDGHESTLKREHVQTSATKAILSGPGRFAEKKINEANFRDILPHMLWKICMYFTYKIHYTNNFRDYQIPNCSWNCTRTVDGCKLPRLCVCVLLILYITIMSC